MENISNFKEELHDKIFRAYVDGDSPGNICLTFGISDYNLRSIIDKCPKKKARLFKQRKINQSKKKIIFISLMQTCHKLDISFWAYLRDRIYQKFEMLPLNSLIISNS